MKKCIHLIIFITNGLFAAATYTPPASKPISIKKEKHECSLNAIPDGPIRTSTTPPHSFLYNHNAHQEITPVDLFEQDQLIEYAVSAPHEEQSLIMIATRSVLHTSPKSSRKSTAHEPTTSTCLTPASPTRRLSRSSSHEFKSPPSSPSKLLHLQHIEERLKELFNKIPIHDVTAEKQRNPNGKTLQIPLAGGHIYKITMQIISPDNTGSTDASSS